MRLLDNTLKSNKLLTVLAAYICIFYPLTDFGIGNVVGWAFLLGYWFFKVATTRGRFYLTRNRIGYCIVVFVALVYFIMPNARNYEKSTQALIVNMVICAIYVLTATIDEKEIVRMMRVLVFFAIAFSLYIIFCRMFPNVYLNTIVPRLSGVNTAEATLSIRRGYGAHIANSITFGPYIICMGIFYCLGDLLFKVNINNSKRIIIYELIFLAAILCEGRRSELIATIFTTFIVYVISTPNNAKKIMKRFGIFILIVLIGIAVVVVLLRNGYLVRFVNTADLLKGGITADELNKLTSSRYRLWEYAWSFFKESPIFGIGWSSFSLYVVTVVNNVHNCYLQFLCETGLVGFFAIMIPMIVLLVRSISAMKQIVARKSRVSSLVGCAITVSVGMQILFLILYAMDPVFYKGYYHMLHIILLLYSEYAIRYSKVRYNKLRKMKSE